MQTKGFAIDVDTECACMDAWHKYRKIIKEICIYICRDENVCLYANNLVLIRLICFPLQKLERLQPWMGWWVWWRTGWQIVTRTQTVDSCMSVCRAIRSASAMPSTPFVMSGLGKASLEDVHFDIHVFLSSTLLWANK